MNNYTKISMILSLLLLSSCEGGAMISNEDREAAKSYGININDYVEAKHDIQRAKAICPTIIVSDYRNDSLSIAPKGTYERVSITEKTIRIESNNILATGLVFGDPMIPYICDYYREGGAVDFEIGR